MATRKKNPLTRTALAMVSILAISAVAYGCSSGPSQSELDAETERADQAEMDAQERADQIAALQAQINALRMQLGLEADDDLSDSIEELQNEITSLEQQIAAAAEEKRLAEERAAAHFAMALAAIQGSATAEAAQAAYDAVDQTMLTAVQDAALRDALEARKTALAAAAEAAEEARKAANAVAASMGTAIAAEAAQTTDAGLGGTAITATGNAEGAYNIAIERDRSGTTVTVTVEGATDDEDEDFNEVFTTTDDGGTVSIQNRIHETDEDDGTTMWEQVNVFTDIEAPTPTEFGEVHDLDIRVDGETGNMDNPNDALQIAAGNLGMVMASAFTAPAGTTGTSTLNFQQAVADTDNTDGMDDSIAAAEIPGTFDGAMGTYKCNASTSSCTVTVNTMGVVSGVSNDNDWIFIPADGAMVDVADADYLHYGTWLKATTDKDDAITYNEVETFAGSSIDATDDVSGVTGSATYEGGANGQYVRNVLTSEGEIDTAMAGQFAALASLTANFGGNDIAVNMQNRLTGKIHGFQLFDIEGNTHLDWMDREVMLQGDITTSSGTVTSTDGATGDGAWNATFHGPVGDHDSDAGTPEIPYPHSVVGEFNASFTDGSLAGAFGARIVEDE